MIVRSDHFGWMKRPRHLDPPDYLSKSEPAPEPGPVETAQPADGDPERLDPTRYGDWEKKGIAIDF